MRLGMRGHSRRRIILPCLFVLVCVVACIILKRAEPVFVAQCSNYSNTAFTDIVNRCVADMARSGEMSGFFNNEGGKSSINAVETDTARINLVRSQLLINVQDALNADYPAYIHIPLGSLFGSGLLTYYGPELSVKIIPISIVNGELEESFEAAGINQVRHSISMKITVKMRYVGYTMDETELIGTTVPIAESMISGDVPRYYGGGYMHGF